MCHLFDILAHQARQTPKAIALSDPSGELTYSDLIAELETLTPTMKGFGLQRIGIYADNSIDWVLVDLLALRLGITVVPLPLYFSEAQLIHTLHESHLDGLFVSKQRLPQSVELHLQPEQHRFIHFTFRRTHLSPESRSIDKNTFSKYVKITYTSGSTGTPSGVPLSLQSMLNVSHSIADILAKSGVTQHLCLLPLSTLLENIAGVYAQLILGNTVHLAPCASLGLSSNHHFNGTQLIEALATRSTNRNTYRDTYRNIDSLILLPHMLKILCELTNSSPLQSVKFIAVGGGKINPALIEKARQNNLPVYEGYGLSECASVVSLNTPDNYRSGSVGKPLPHLGVRIAQDGEIVVSHRLANGDPQPTEFYTGDIGYLDDDSYLYVSGRKKNVIISSFGRNISPEWVESAFLAHPAITQCVVVGDGEPELSALIYAPKHVTSTRLKQLVAEINQSLPDYAQILHWQRLEQTLSTESGELTANGKIRREVILQRYSQHLYPQQTTTLQESAQ